MGRNGREGRRKGCRWEEMAGRGGEEERLEEEANNCSPPVRFPIRPVQYTIHTMSIFILRLYTVLYREYNFSAVIFAVENRRS